ncbi:hypothetical protein Fmac_002087 [Flemingia macrophylla]|uniref:Uncharacterized protein n=1 Tax=Flemingia macrophylla TaxID=520843 RepID=A0ABD1NIX6_9FABA
MWKKENLCLSTSKSTFHCGFRKKKLSFVSSEKRRAGISSVSPEKKKSVNLSSSSGCSIVEVPRGSWIACCFGAFISSSRSRRRCPLAATLSEKGKVLLLERGGSPYGNPNITNLNAFGAALSDTSPSSPAHRFISQDGGGTSINAGFYTRAGPHYIRTLTNGWSEWWPLSPLCGRQWQSAVKDGLLEAGVVPYNGFTLDHPSGTKFGGSIFDLMLTDTPLQIFYNNEADPTRVTVLLHSTVHKILFTNKGGPSPVANGVIFRDGRGKEHNISVVLEQPSVGLGMSDNPMKAVFVPSPVPVEVSLIEVVGITNFGSYIEAASGEFFAAASTKDYGMFSPKFKDPRELERCERASPRVSPGSGMRTYMSASMLLNMTTYAFPCEFVAQTQQHLNVAESVLQRHCDDDMALPRGLPKLGEWLMLIIRLLAPTLALRVIDGSTFNYSPGTNPQATVMMLGRYMGVKILTETC